MISFLLLRLISARFAVIETLRTYEDLLHIGIFVGFFLMAALAIWSPKSKTVRRIFVVGLILGMFAASLLAVNPFPFTHLHKYSGDPGTTGSHTEIRFVDGSGNEIRVDNAPYVTAPNYGRGSSLAETIACDMDRSEQQDAADALLTRGNEYRDDVESNRAVLHRLSFPPSAVAIQWDESKIEDMIAFERVRIYTVQYEFKSGGYQIESRSERRILEISPTQTRASNLGALC